MGSFDNGFIRPSPDGGLEQQIKNALYENLVASEDINAGDLVGRVVTGAELAYTNGALPDAYVLSIVWLDSSRFAIMYQATSSSVGVKVGKINSDNSITFGSAYTESGYVYGNMCLLDTDKLIFAYAISGAGTARLRVATISDTSISAPNLNNFMANSGACVIRVVALTPALIVVGCVLDGASDYLYAVAGTISGDTITFGSNYTVIAQAYNTGGNQYLNQWDLCKIDSTRFAMGIYGTSGYAEIIAGSVSGTVITLGSKVSTSSASTSVAVVLENENTLLLIWKCYTYSSEYPLRLARFSISGTALTSVGNIFTLYLSSDGESADISQSLDSNFYFKKSATPNTYYLLVMQKAAFASANAINIVFSATIDNEKAFINSVIGMYQSGYSGTMYCVMDTFENRAAVGVSMMTSGSYRAVYASATSGQICKSSKPSGGYKFGTSGIAVGGAKAGENITCRMWG